MTFHTRSSKSGTQKASSPLPGIGSAPYCDGALLSVPYNPEGCLGCPSSPLGSPCSQALVFLEKTDHCLHATESDTCFCMSVTQNIIMSVWLLVCGEFECHT